jgi:hypothetical protein
MYVSDMRFQILFDKKESKLVVIDPLTYEKLQDAKKDEDGRLI